MIDVCLKNTRVSFDANDENQKTATALAVFNWSGRRDSNSRHLPWQGNALPTEPLPHSVISKLVGVIGLEPVTSCL